MRKLDLVAQVRIKVVVDDDLDDGYVERMIFKAIDNGIDMGLGAGLGIDAMDTSVTITGWPDAL